MIAGARPGPTAGPKTAARRPPPFPSATASRCPCAQMYHESAASVCDRKARGPAAAHLGLTHSQRAPLIPGGAKKVSAQRADPARLRGSRSTPTPPQARPSTRATTHLPQPRDPTAAGHARDSPAPTTNAPPGHFIGRERPGIAKANAQPVQACSGESPSGATGTSVSPPTESRGSGLTDTRNAPATELIATSPAKMRAAASSGSQCGVHRGAPDSGWQPRYQGGDAGRRPCPLHAIEAKRTHHAAKSERTHGDLSPEYPSPARTAANI